MSLASCPAISITELTGWGLFFAKEPAAGGSDSTPSDMDKTVVLGPPGKKGPTPPTMKERILFLVLILIIVGAGGYLAVNPDVLMTLMGDAPGAPPPPQVVAKPPTPAPAPAPAGTMPAPAPAPGAVAAAPAAVAGNAMPAAAPAGETITTPLFGEGQKVSVSAPTPLTADSAGKQPSPTTAVPGSTLVVLDADLQNFAWIYSVRTEQGKTGWVPEKNLVAK
jgi:hypothetical protein